jgi:sugar lactone lactonase YvrE
MAPATATSTSLPIITSPALVILATNLPGPDDLLLSPDGSIYLSDVIEGTVRRYTNGGSLNLIVGGLDEPEGMVFLPDGSLVIAEQGRNRLVRYEPGMQTLRPFYQLSNATSQLGVDGLSWDAITQTIIVPDSPNGTILRLSPDAQTVTHIASGFSRPTGAWVEPEGSILVVDENGNSLSRIHPDGRLEKLADLPIPDDVIEDPQGNLFVITLGDNAVHLISRVTGQDTVLASGIVDPQGIIFDIDGNLVVTDSGNHRLIKVLIH